MALTYSLCVLLLCFGIVSFADEIEHSVESESKCNVTSYTSTTSSSNAHVTRLATTLHNLYHSLTDSHRSQFSYCLGNREQHSWTNVPGRRSGGIELGDLSIEQEQHVWQLLSGFLSNDAYDNIRLLATDIELASGAGTIEDYTVASFGNPNTDPAWGFQFDGHHIALNFLVDGDHVLLSPAFVGAQPTSLNSSYPLGRETTLGREFWEGLSQVQKQAAYVDDLVRRDVFVGSGRGQIDQGLVFDVSAFDYIGLPISLLKDKQRKELRNLLSVYFDRLNGSLQTSTWNRIVDGLDDGFFVYSTRGDRIYYRIYAANTVLVEYSDVAEDHIHTVFRLLGERPYRDYGGFADVSAEASSVLAHLLTADHHQEDRKLLWSTSTSSR